MILSDRTPNGSVELRPVSIRDAETIITIT